MSIVRRILLVTPSGDRLPVPGECVNADQVKNFVEDQLGLAPAIQRLYLEDVEIDGSAELNGDIELDLVLVLGEAYTVSRRALAERVDPLARESIHPPRSEVEGRQIELMDLPIPLRNPNDIHKDPAFQDAVKLAAPLRDAWSSSRPQRQAALRHVIRRLDGPTIVTSVFDRNYIPFLRNWYASCVKHDIDPRRKTLLFPVDAAANEAANDLGFATLFEAEGTTLQAAEIAEGSGRTDRRSIALRKLGVIADLLEQDREILFQDIDMVWRQDPVESIRRLADHDALDALFMNDGPNARFTPNHYNTGFFFLRNNDCTRAAWSHVMDRWPAVFHLGSDQDYFNQLLPSLEARGFRVARLDDRRFVNGHSLVAAEAHHRALPLDPAVVHVSWTLNLAAKIDKLKRLGYWYLNAE